MTHPQIEQCEVTGNNSHFPVLEKTTVECDCGAEVIELKNCGHCQHEGCVHCMDYDEDYNEYFCNKECLLARITGTLDKQADKLYDVIRQRDYLYSVVESCLKSNGDLPFIIGFLKGAKEHIENWEK